MNKTINILSIGNLLLIYANVQKKITLSIMFKSNKFILLNKKLLYLASIIC